MVTETDFTNLRDLIHFHESLSQPQQSPAPESEAAASEKGQDNETPTRKTQCRPRSLGKHTRCEECCRSRRRNTSRKRKRTSSESRPTEVPQRSLTRRNIRERSRMSSFNQWFSRLQERIPNINRAPKRVPKEKILRCAINHIKNLENILASPIESTEISTDITEHIFGVPPTTTQTDCFQEQTNSVFDISAWQHLQHMLSKVIPDDQNSHVSSRTTPLDCYSTIVGQPHDLPGSMTIKSEVESDQDREDFLEGFDSLLETSSGDISEAERGTIEQLERTLSSNIPHDNRQLLGNREFLCSRRSSSRDNEDSIYYIDGHSSSHVESHSDGFFSESSGYLGDISNIHSDASDMTSVEIECSPNTPDDATGEALVSPE